jgi:hypothetical protein
MKPNENWYLPLFKCPMCDCRRMHLCYSGGDSIMDGFEICLYCGAERSESHVIQQTSDYGQFVRLYGEEYMDRMNTAYRVVEHFKNE